MTEKSQYPNWQDTIRKAQVIQQQRDAEVQTKLNQEKAESDAKLGQELAEALGYFGITVETPLTNSVCLDDIHFSLRNGLWCSDGLEGVLVSFTLRICINEPETPWRDHYGYFYEKDMWTDVKISKMPISDNWQLEQALLANKIDYVQDSYRDNQQRWQDSQQKKIQVESMPTVAEALLSALDNYLEEKLNMRFE